LSNFGLIHIIVVIIVIRAAIWTRNLSKANEKFSIGYKISTLLVFFIYSLKKQLQEKLLFPDKQEESIY
jgi:hypothetical protein